MWGSCIPERSDSKAFCFLIDKVFLCYQPQTALFPLLMSLKCTICENPTLSNTAWNKSQPTKKKKPPKKPPNKQTHTQEKKKKITERINEQRTGGQERQADLHPSLKVLRLDKVPSNLLWIKSCFEQEAGLLISQGFLNLNKAVLGWLNIHVNPQDHCSDSGQKWPGREKSRENDTDPQP